MSRAELLYELEKRGYIAKITLNAGCKDVTFTGMYSEPHTLKKCYPIDCTDWEIRLDTATELMNWAGLYIKETLEVKGF